MWASTLLKVQAASGIFKFKLFALRFWPSKATQNTIFISQSKLRNQENKLKVFWVIKNILGNIPFSKIKAKLLYLNQLLKDTLNTNIYFLFL